MNPTMLTGRCACGAVRYCCSAPHEGAGRSPAAALVVRAETFKWLAGAPSYQPLQTSPGHTKQLGFCADCGTLLVTEVAQWPGVVLVRAASLVQPADAAAHETPLLPRKLAQRNEVRRDADPAPAKPVPADTLAK